ncbi:MarR family winged helix-turn-helix transcriptional regulator [Aureibacter tunicatorum]|uniref:DNA-binding MarR family transcriptional regulator n=1 Tax=Aureibacter tunicatorum TaxID=866807 RepID=A0AAE3XM29_9BACT|nr:MarR family transcriptional regulator [Aureibacter tunicatorum]MDR6238508.1 DNA-binding MarR family transcriptional regulator [Aureibacter tunicatorum]BDD05559.1 MarR family transcriptional regulator [Aureibacter tunicatorum]
MGRIEDEMNTKFANGKQRMMSSIVFTSNWIQNRFGDFIKPFGISSQQFNILRILRGAKEWLSMNEVKKRMVEKSPNTTRLCDKLLAKELILREKCHEDKRVVYLKISDKGLELLSEIDQAEAQIDMCDYFENFTEEEADLVTNVLNKMRG